jgi:chaperonin cofactor prefoldin
VSVQIAAEQLQASLDRRAELEQALEDAQGQLQTARQTGTPAVLAKAQALVTALEAALDALAAELQTLERQEAEDRQRAVREATLQQLLRQAQGATQSLDQYGADMHEANELLQPLVARMKASQALRAQLRRDFLELLSETAGGGVRKREQPRDVSFDHYRAQAFDRANSEAHRLLQQLEAQGADLAAVLNNAGELDTDLHSLFDRPAPLPTPAPHGQALSAMCNAWAGMRVFPQHITG